MNKQRKNNLLSIFNYLEIGIVTIGGIAVILMMVLIVTDVLLRNTINSPIRGGKELVELLMIATIFFGMSYTQKENGHIGIDFIQGFLKGFSAKVINTVTLLLSLGINGLLTYFIYVQVISDYKKGVATIYLQWPQWIITSIVLLGMFILTIRLLIELVLSFKGNSKVEARTEGIEEGDYHD